MRMNELSRSGSRLPQNRPFHRNNSTERRQILVKTRQGKEVNPL